MSLNPYNLNIAVAVVANAIACQLGDDELTLWASVFTILGDMLGGISALRELGEEECPKKGDPCASAEEATA